MTESTTAKCKICKLLVEQEVMYTSKEQDAYIYKCGCASYHSGNSETWISRRGQVEHFINESGERDCRSL